MRATLKKLIDKWESDYKKLKAQEIEDLHNALVEVIAESGAHISNILTVLEIIKHEVMTEKLKSIEKGVEPSKAFMKPIGFNVARALGKSPEKEGSE